jgi:uncharacterized membrane protein YGL010W
LACIPHGFLTALIERINDRFVPYVHFGTVVIAIGLLFYLRLSFVMAMGILIWCLFCLWGNVWLGVIEPFGLVLWQSSLSLFVLAWIGQFIGHKIEGESPSFFKDLQFLMIGPAWLISFIYKKIGIKY